MFCSWMRFTSAADLTRCFQSAVLHDQDNLVHLKSRTLSLGALLGLSPEVDQILGSAYDSVAEEAA